nr:hypothetical protein [uncultured Agathobaculum sp.]
MAFFLLRQGGRLQGVLKGGRSCAKAAEFFADGSKRENAHYNETEHPRQQVARAAVQIPESDCAGGFAGCDTHDRKERKK